MHSRLLKRGLSDDDVTRQETHGGASPSKFNVWGRGDGGTRNGGGAVSVDIRDTVPGRHSGSPHDDSDGLSSGGESDDSRATVVTHHESSKLHRHQRVTSNISSDGCTNSDVETNGSYGGRGDRAQGGFVNNGTVGGLLTPGLFSGSGSPLRRVDSQTHVVQALKSVPGLHKRGIDLPLTKRLAFRKCRGVARNKSLIVFLVLLFIVAIMARRAPTWSDMDNEIGNGNLHRTHSNMDGGGLNTHSHRVTGNSWGLGHHTGGRVY